MTMWTVLPVTGVDVFKQYHTYIFQFNTSSAHIWLKNCLLTSYYLKKLVKLTIVCSSIMDSAATVIYDYEMYRQNIWFNTNSSYNIHLKIILPHKPLKWQGLSLVIYSGCFFLLFDYFESKVKDYFHHLGLCPGA